MFEALLKAIHSVVGGSWGWSIVILTVLVRAVLIPLTLKQFHSMQKLQRLQPQMKEIQNKYKDDKQRQQQEMMKFYKENQVNPFGSCLPLVAQLPVFVGLFYMLRSSLRADICPQSQPGAHLVNGHWVGISKAHTVPCGPHNGAQFLFIPDLTNKATGAVLVVLLILYVGTQLASSLMMSSPTMDKTQRQIMLFLPLVFVFIIINFPAGVIVYWITTNAWTMGQQYVIKKRIGPLGSPVPVGASDGGGPEGRGGSGSDGRKPAPDGQGGLVGLLRGVTKSTGTEKSSGAAKSTGAATSTGTAKSTGAAKSTGTAKSTEDKEKEPVVAGARSRPARTSAPPPPPRKKKKRSGRRR
ncbi:MAG: membrane protein insertase YidC [Solirubrobacterales bacterium]|nr:membrane protein insertase YidC [Solirubrobacterales bacterium]